MSAPAANALSPAPVRMTTRTLLSFLKPTSAPSSSSSIAALIAFNTSGRLSVITAIGSVRWLVTIILARVREREHQPADDEGHDDEAGEHEAAEACLLTDIVLC